MTKPVLLFVELYYNSFNFMGQSFDDFSLILKLVKDNDLEYYVECSEQEIKDHPGKLYQVLHNDDNYYVDRIEYYDKDPDPIEWPTNEYYSDNEGDTISSESEDDDDDNDNDYYDYLADQYAEYGFGENFNDYDSDDSDFGDSMINSMEISG